MWLAGVRRGAGSIISSGRWSLRGPLHVESLSPVSCLRRSLSLEDRKRLHFNTSCLEQSRCWNVGAVRCFTTVPGPRKERAKRIICSEDGCSITATFGWEGGRREFCSKHKEEAMIQLATRLCEHPGKCRKVACFGFVGSSYSLRYPQTRRNGRCKESKMPRARVYAST